MNKSIRSIAACVAFATATGPLAFAAQLPGLDAPGGVAQQRAALARQIIEKWSPHVSGTFGVDPKAWARDMGPALERASLAALEQAAASPGFDAMNDAVIRSVGAVPKALGDVDKELVYVPITPCRIADTRLGGGGIIAAGSVRSFDVTAVSDYSFQGGAANNCGGAGAAGSFAAVALNFTVVSTAAGHITAYPFLAAQPLAATLNYGANDVRGNFAIIRLDQGASANEISVYSTSQTHLIVDMVGYFTNPVAYTPRPLDCVTTALESESVGAGETQNVNAPACPAGYTATGTNCESSIWDMPIVFASAGTCSAQNNSAGQGFLRASRTCCRSGT